jgi:hypothetical protein
MASSICAANALSNRERHTIKAYHALPATGDAHL